jgi:hypothetical protein
MCDEQTFIAACQFPEDGWTGHWRLCSRQASPNLRADWKQRVELEPPPLHHSAECVTLDQLRQQERASHAKDILAQAQTERAAIWPVQRVLGSADLPTHPQTKALHRLLLDNILGPIFQFKEQFNRGRPYHCCAENLDPMFADKADPLHPGHPAYPSGHSTQAHALAYLLASWFPQREDEFLQAAGKVAKNREIAGLHYPSDSLAGKKLARQLVVLLLQNTGFKAAADLARLEWP